MVKVSLQTSLERNPSNSYIFLFDINFENLNVRLYVIISFIFVKFLESQRLIVMSSLTCLNFMFLW